MYGESHHQAESSLYQDFGIKYLSTCVCKSPYLQSFFFGLENGKVEVGKDENNVL